jgi:hypothetical protein
MDCQSSNGTGPWETPRRTGMCFSPSTSPECMNTHLEPFLAPSFRCSQLRRVSTERVALSESLCATNKEHYARGGGIHDSVSCHSSILCALFLLCVTPFFPDCSLCDHGPYIKSTVSLSTHIVFGGSLVVLWSCPTQF